MTDLISNIIDLAIRIQQVPAPTFDEGPRAEFVRDLFLKENLTDVSIDSLGNVYARLAGRAKKEKPLIASAHLDTVFPTSISLQVREEMGKIVAPGIGDNSLGVASLFGLLWMLRENKSALGRDVWLVANVGEEGLGDLRGIREVVERFDKEVVGYLILEGLALGHIYYRGIGVKRYRIRANAAGGHSWSDYGRPSAVHELAALVTQITSIDLPLEPRTTLNVGTIGGGTGINVLAAEAKCELDLRSEDPAVLAKLAHQVEGLIRNTNREGVRMQAEVIGQRPAGEISLDHPFVLAAMECSRTVGLNPVMTAGSTDANIPLSRGIPAVVMGITTGGGAHTVHEYINTEPIAKGMDCMTRFVTRVTK